MKTKFFLTKKIELQIKFLILLKKQMKIQNRFSFTQLEARVEQAQL